MATTDFTDKVTVVPTDWLNEVDALVYQVFNGLGTSGADGTMLVSDGTTYVEESGATLRNSIGLGTGDSPTFTALTLTGAFTSLGIDDNATSEQLQIADAAMHLNPNTLIGDLTTTPDGTLHVHTSSAGSVTANVVGDQLIVEVGASGGASILTPDASTGYLLFGSPDNNAGGLISWNSNADEMKVASNKARAILNLGGGAQAEGGRFDADGTAGNTRFFVYDVDNATLERVSVGAADSGGTNYKVLRIPN